MDWPQAFETMTDIGVGWEIPNCASISTRRYLFETVRRTNAKRVLEIGTYVGVSTLAMALALPPNGKLLTVDLTDVMAPDGYWATETDAEGHRIIGASPAVLWGHAGVANRISAFHAPAPMCLEWLLPQFDFAFVDAWKHEETVYQTLLGVLRVLKPGGIIAVHDVYPEGEIFRPEITNDPGPWRAVERLKRERPELLLRYLRALPDGGEDRMAEIRP